MSNGDYSWESYRRAVLDKQDAFDESLRAYAERLYKLEMSQAVAQGRAGALGMVAGGLTSAFLVLLKIIIDYYKP